VAAHCSAPGLLLQKPTCGRFFYACLQSRQVRVKIVSAAGARAGRVAAIKQGAGAGRQIGRME